MSIVYKIIVLVHVLVGAGMLAIGIYAITNSEEPAPETATKAPFIVACVVGSLQLIAALFSGGIVYYTGEGSMEELRCLVNSQTFIVLVSYIACVVGVILHVVLGVNFIQEDTSRNIDTYRNLSYVSIVGYVAVLIVTTASMFLCYVDGRFEELGPHNLPLTLNPQLGRVSEDEARMIQEQIRVQQQQLQQTYLGNSTMVNNPCYVADSAGLSH